MAFEKLVRVRRRLVIPGAGITVALAGLALLVALPDEPAPRHGPRHFAAREAPRSEAPKLAPPGAAPAGPASPAVAPPEQAAAPASWQAAAPVQPLAFSPGQHRRIDRGHGALTFRPDPPADAEIAAAQGVPARLEVLDRALQARDPSDSMALLERLLDRTPGQTAEEQRALRAALVARLAPFKTCARALARLVAELDLSLGAAERLAAIEVLSSGGVPPQAREALERLAAGEPDADVRRRARAALGRPPVGQGGGTPPTQPSDG